MNEKVFSLECRVDIGAGGAASLGGKGAAAGCFLHIQAKFPKEVSAFQIYEYGVLMSCIDADIWKHLARQVKTSWRRS